MCIPVILSLPASPVRPPDASASNTLVQPTHILIDSDQTSWPGAHQLHPKLYKAISPISCFDKSARELQIAYADQSSKLATLLSICQTMRVGTVQQTHLLASQLQLHRVLLVRECHENYLRQTQLRSQPLHVH